jgi:hypothetical protein
VFVPAVAKLNDKISKWFAENVIADTYKIEISGDRITIWPSYTTEYGNTISIDYRCSWREDSAYFETSSYRPDLNSQEDNTIATKYYSAMAKVAVCFDAICEQYKTKWLPAYNKLTKANSEKNDEIYKIEREIRNCESEIATMEKEVYFQSGFECKLLDNTRFSYTDNSAHKEEHSIRLQNGRGRWDYFSINKFKVISFPKAKHAKVVIEFNYGKDDATVTREVSKQRYAEFVNEVYNWQTSGAKRAEESANERAAMYAEANA